jgi:hypothetical protein
MTENSQDRWCVSPLRGEGTTSNTAKAIAGPRIDSTEPRNGQKSPMRTFARFSEPRDFRVFQHNRRQAAVRQRLWYIDLIPSYCGYDGDQRHFGRPGFLRSRDNGGSFACGDPSMLKRGI